MFLEIFFLGVYLCLFLVTICHSKRGVSRDNPVLLVMISVFILTLCRTPADLGIWYRTLFVHCGIRLQKVDYILRGLQDAFAMVPMLVADMLLFWRLYVVWSYDARIVAPPICAWVLAIIGAAVSISYDFILAGDPENAEHSARYLTWITVFCATNVAYNYYATLCIVWRLCWMAYDVKDLSKRNARYYLQVMSALIESGVMYSAVVLFFMVAGLVGNDILLTAANDIASVVIGIAATLIVLQLS